MDTQKIESVCEKTFIRFCRKSIANAATDFERVQKNRRGKEFLYEDLPPMREMVFAIRDPYEQIPVFHVVGKNNAVDGEQLFDAIHILTELRRKIVTMYYFLHMSDREIGLILNMKRRTVNSNRGSALVEMKSYLEVSMYGT